MEVSWESLVEDLQNFPGSALQLQAAPQWGEEGSAYVVVLLNLGEVFDSTTLKVRITSDSRGTHIELVEAAQDQPWGKQRRQRRQRRRRGPVSRAREQAVPEGVAEALAGAGAAVADCRGPLSVRSALLRLCDELCVELTAEQTATLSALGRRAALEPELPEEELPVGPLPLFRDASRATSGGASALSFEEQEDGLMATDSEEGEAEDAGPCAMKPRVVPAWRCSEDLDREGPPVEVMAWTAAMDGLRRFPGQALQLKSAGCWDGREGLVEIALKAPEDCSEWERLDVMLVVGARRPTAVELKGAQVVPPAVAAAVAEINRRGETGSGPQSLCTVFHALFQALGVDLDENQQEIIKALGSRVKSVGARLRVQMEGGEGGSELQRELLAVEALKVQSGLIDQQIQHLEHRQSSAPCIAPELQCEVERLKRSLADVSAERTAAAAAVQAAMLECTDTGGCTPVSISVHLRDAPSQSLRGRSVEEAAEIIKKGLASSGPWGHYAAHQFSSMLAREQELHGEFVCFYHSYSYAALLYEVQAVVARRLLGLPADSAPLPRLSAAAAGAGDLSSLRKLGGRDHDPGFRALGLSCSCSVFAYGSEAPPMTCFQGGYSCTDVSFRQLLVDFLARCCDDGGRGEELADAVAKAGERHALNVQMYRQGPSSVAAPGALTGYMLQVFVRRSLVKDFAYPSEAMGRPIQRDIIQYVDQEKAQADGQARLLFRPDVFLDPASVRLYHYCARPLQSCMDTEVQGSRGCLIKDLGEALSPLFREPIRSIKQRLRLK